MTLKEKVIKNISDGEDVAREVTEAGTFYFVRDKVGRHVFSIGWLLNQIIDWTKETGSKPTKIVLPVEEYYYLALFLKESADNVHFLGIPVEFTSEEPDGPFCV